VLSLARNSWIAQDPDHAEGTIETTGDPVEDLQVKIHTMIDMITGAAARVSLIGREGLWRKAWLAWASARQPRQVVMTDAGIEIVIEAAKIPMMIMTTGETMIVQEVILMAIPVTPAIHVGKRDVGTRELQRVNGPRATRTVLDPQQETKSGRRR
jgi:hypothetical protein